MTKTSCIIALLCSLSLASISLSAHARIDKIRLTAEERNYLSDRAPIKLCIDPNWMPYEAWDPKLGYIGIAADYVAVFSAMLDVESPSSRSTPPEAVIWRKFEPEDHRPSSSARSGGNSMDGSQESKRAGTRRVAHADILLLIPAKTASPPPPKALAFGCTGQR